MAKTCAEIKKSVARFARMFDELINSGEEHKIERIIRSYNSRNPITPAESVELNRYFFIWIGCISEAALEYIDVWKETISSKARVRIYYDSHFLLFNCYGKAFRKLYGVNDATPIEHVVAFQNHLKKQLDCLIQDGLTFDDALIRVMRTRLPSEAHKLKKELTRARMRIALLVQSYDLIDVRSECELFLDEFYYEIYDLELTLRANAAAAADILRLLVLYLHGGVYVDVDTLPALQPVYGAPAPHASCNVQNIVRSEYFLRQRRTKSHRMKGQRADISRYEAYLNAIDSKIVRHIKRCTRARRTVRLTVCNVRVMPDFISMAAFETLCEFNNNVLAAAKNSRLIRIVLLEIKRRYKFVFKHRFDIGPNQSVAPDHYLSRLANYRYDGLNDEENVTLFLTGPILILEVLLGVAYKVFSVESGISPLALSYALHLNQTLVAYQGHTGYTPEHMKSSWMSNKCSGSTAADTCTPG